jgi:hypothetical protein
MEEPNNCPKPNCGRPESTHRYAAGKKLSICGNGHSWDQVEVAAQRAKAREAETKEAGPNDYQRIELNPYHSLKKRLRDLDFI